MASRAHRAIAAAAVMLAVAAGPAGSSAASTAGGSSRAETPGLTGRGWVWPATAFRLVQPFVAPAHRYAPGHRGIDLQLVGGDALRAPAAGVVAFAGVVVDRGVLTIDHGDGLVSTLEPVASPLAPGTEVARGDAVAILMAGGHAAPGTVHFGVRHHGEYINPMLLLGGVPRAVLLPCC